MNAAINKKIWWLPLLLAFDIIYYLFIQFLTSSSLEMFRARLNGMGVIVLFIISLISLACVRWVKARMEKKQFRSVAVKYLQILVYSFLLFILLTAGLQFGIEYAAGQRRSLSYVIGNGLTYVFLHLVVGNAFIALSYFRESSRLREDLILSEKTKTETELRVLQQQMSPHFLFNNLNTLASLIPQDAEKAGRFTRRLSAIFRYFSQNAQKDLVVLSEELNFLDDYMQLMKDRFGKAYLLDTHLEGIHPQDYWIIPVSLQLLIENVIKHNSGDRENPLRADLFVEGDYLCMKNELRPKAQAGQVVSRQGLRNLQERYHLLTGQDIFFGRENDFFLVKLPLIKRIDDENINH